MKPFRRSEDPCKSNSRLSCEQCKNPLTNDIFQKRCCAKCGLEQCNRLAHGNGDLCQYHFLLAMADYKEYKAICGLLTEEQENALHYYRRGTSGGNDEKYKQLHDQYLEKWITLDIKEKRQVLQRLDRCIERRKRHSSMYYSGSEKCRSTIHFTEINALQEFYQVLQSKTPKTISKPVAGPVPFETKLSNTFFALQNVEPVASVSEIEDEVAAMPAATSIATASNTLSSSSNVFGKDLKEVKKTQKNKKQKSSAPVSTTLLYEWKEFVDDLNYGDDIINEIKIQNDKSSIYKMDRQLNLTNPLFINMMCITTCLLIYKNALIDSKSAILYEYAKLKRLAANKKETETFFFVFVDKDNNIFYDSISYYEPKQGIAISVPLYSEPTQDMQIRLLTLKKQKNLSFKEKAEMKDLASLKTFFQKEKRIQEVFHLQNSLPVNSILTECIIEFYELWVRLLLFLVLHQRTNGFNSKLLGIIPNNSKEQALQVLKEYNDTVLESIFQLLMVKDVNINTRRQLKPNSKLLKLVRPLVDVGNNGVNQSFIHALKIVAQSLSLSINSTLAEQRLQRTRALNVVNSHFTIASKELLNINKYAEYIASIADTWQFYFQGVIPR